MAKKTPKWRKNQAEWRDRVYKQGWAIDALEDDLGYSSDLNGSEIDISKCLLYLALLGNTIPSACEAMGWKISTFRGESSRGIYRDLADLKNPDNPQSVGWFDIAIICDELGYYDLDKKKARENQEKAEENLQFLNRFRELLEQLRKLIRENKIEINIINCSEEERAKIEKLIKKLFGL